VLLGRKTFKTMDTGGSQDIVFCAELSMLPELLKSGDSQKVALSRQAVAWNVRYSCINLTFLPSYAIPLPAVQKNTRISHMEQINLDTKICFKKRW